MFRINNMSYSNSKIPTILYCTKKVLHHQYFVNNFSRSSRFPPDFLLLIPFYDLPNDLPKNDNKAKQTNKRQANAWGTNKLLDNSSLIIVNSEHYIVTLVKYCWIVFMSIQKFSCSENSQEKVHNLVKF